MFDSIKKIFGGKDNTTSSQNSAAGLPHDQNSNEEMLHQAARELAEGHELAEDGSRVSGAPSRPAMDVTAMDLPLPSPTELKLEALFHHAAHEESKRNEFLSALLNAELFVIGQAEPAENGAVNIQLATQQAENEPVALAFTSLSAMAQAGAPSGQAFVKMKTNDLLRMIRTQLGFVLNPGNRVAKHFNKWEVEQLTGGSQTSEVREMAMPENNQISIGQPATYPPGLREALSKASSAIEIIRDIHTGLMAVSESQPPVLLAVISLHREVSREEFLNLINEFGPHLQAVGPVPINFAPMNPNFQDLTERRALISVNELLT